jgi:transposase
MISVGATMRVLVCVEPVDFRKGIDGLSGLCRNHLQEEAMNGSVYVFRNRRGSSVKLLYYDGQGYWLAMKRLSSGKFSWWPQRRENDQKTMQLMASELSVLLWNGHVGASGVGWTWKKVVNE